MDYLTKSKSKLGHLLKELFKLVFCLKKANSQHKKKIIKFLRLAY